MSLPSLSGRRAFEAAARTGSFTAAAADLHVTQAAVSRSVKALEQQPGCALFQPRANALALPGFDRFRRWLRRGAKAELPG